MGCWRFWRCSRWMTLPFCANQTRLPATHSFSSDFAFFLCVAVCVTSQQACRALKAQRRWAVTGTPLQNRIGDMFGLLAFLGLKPLDDKAFWRRCVERPLRQRDSRALLTLKVGGFAFRVLLQGLRVVQQQQLPQAFRALGV